MATRRMPSWMIDRRGTWRRISVKVPCARTTSRSTARNRISHTGRTGPVLPVWLILFLAVDLLVVLAHGTFTLIRRQVPRRSIIQLGILRVAIVLLFALVLLHPVVAYKRSTERRP